MEQIKDLIDKIKEEGIKAAGDKAHQIEEAAKKSAEDIIAKAHKKADKIISEAKEKDALAQQAAKSSLKQVSRDLLISLKREIDNMLNRVIAANMRKALTPDELSKIISALVEKQDIKDMNKIEIMAGNADFNKLEGLFSNLKNEIKKGITLKPSEDILGGFIISYDAGKSHFDFTVDGLAEYIGTYLRPKLAEILKG